MATPLPLAVIGAGLIGLRHIAVAQKSNAVDLVGVVEPNDRLRGDLATRGFPVFAQLSDLPNTTRAAVVATPTPDHLPTTLACFDRGWAVLVEKPTAGTLDAARHLIDVAAKSDLPFFTGHHRRCHPFSIAARQALANLGDLVGIQGLWSLRKNDAYFDVDWRRKAGSGPLMTNLSHEIDLLRFLFGDISEVTTLLSSTRRGYEIEDTAAMAFRFGNGAMGSFLMSDVGASPWSFEAGSGENPNIAYSGEDYLRVTGTEGALAFPSLTQWGRSDPGEIEWSKPLARHKGPKFKAIDPILDQMNRFARVVAGEPDDVLCTGEDGLKALEMTLAAALSGRLGCPVSAKDVPGDFTGV